MIMLAAALSVWAKRLAARSITCGLRLAVLVKHSSHRLSARHPKLSAKLPMVLMGLLKRLSRLRKNGLTVYSRILPSLAGISAHRLTRPCPRLATLWVLSARLLASWHRQWVMCRSRSTRAASWRLSLTIRVGMTRSKRAAVC